MSRQRHFNDMCVAGGKRVIARMRRRPILASALMIGSLIVLDWIGLLRPVLTAVLLCAVGWLFWTWPKGSAALPGAPLSVSTAAQPVRAQATRTTIRIRSPVLIWPVLLLFAAVGVFVLWLAATYFIEQETRLWNAKTVEATVVRSMLENPTRSRRGGFRYEPRVLHRYTVNGRQYESTRLYPMPRQMHRDTAEAAIALYRPGTKVYTRVPAHRPHDAFLIPRREWVPYGLFILGLASLGVGVGAAWAVLQARRSV